MKIYRSLWSPEVEANIRAMAHSIDEQDAPSEVRFCRRCVVSNQRPRIVFDDEGICSACRYAERKKTEIDWRARDEQLRELCGRHRRSVGYDVIVPCSGGKDSSTIAHRLKHEFDMHPLCVKWAPFAYTDIGFQNFTNFVHSGFDCITAWPDGFLHRKLSRLAIEFLGDAWQPFAYGQLYYAMHMSVKFGIPLVMFGENGEAEYGGDPSANDKPCWDFEDWSRVYLKGSDIDRLSEIGLDLGAFTSDEVIDVSPFYRLPVELGLSQPADPSPVEFHWFGYYTYWHPQGNYYYASEHTGFEANTERTEGSYNKYASLDDRFDGFHYYMAFIKFGIGRATSDAAHEIRDGEITRDEGVALVRRFDGEFPKKFYEEFKAYLGIDDEYFQTILDRYRKPHLWHEVNGEWVLSHAVYDEQLRAA